MILFVGVLDVCIDQERVCFCVNVLHHDLETVECPCFCPTDFVGEVDDEILVHDTIACSKESENVLEEMLLVFVELFPVFHVLSEIDFFCSPKRCSVLFVHSPDIVMFNREQNETIQIFLEHRLYVFSR